MTNLGILHGAGHAEPWIIAMDCAPTRAAVLDYAARWTIEPMFSDFKGRGLENSQLEHADRLERMILIMSLAIYWCVSVGRDDAVSRPTPLEKNARAKRPEPLEPQKTPSQLGFLIHPGLTPPETVPAKRHHFAELITEL